MRLTGTMARLAGAALLPLALAPAANGARPVTVHCGQTVTADTKLANDLRDCPGVGIVIGADGVTLDLNGHTVDGNGTADAEGIQSDGHDRVAIKHGKVTDFVEGVAVIDARGARVRRLSTRRSRHAGIFLDGARVARVSGNATRDKCAGITVTRSRGVRVTRNTVSGGTCSGISIFESDGTRITENSASPAEGPGIIALRDSDRIRIERNSVVNGGGDAIVVAEEGDRAVVTRNTASGNAGVGVVLDAGTARSRVTHNSLMNNSFGGIVVVGSDDNLAADNSILGNGGTQDGAEGGIHVFPFPDDPSIAPDRNAIVRNSLVANGPDGILVDAGSTATAITANGAVQNADDGIDVDAPSTRLTRNTANANGDLGIEAVPGVTDGGGNRASGNGNPLQCTNVFCG